MLLASSIQHLTSIPQPLMAFIFAARWVLPITLPPIEDGAVAIQADRIISVGPAPEIRSKFPAVPIKDLGDAAILPGLVNVHSHIELTAFRGRLEETHFQSWISQLVRLKTERLNEDDLLFSARLGCIEAMRAGITTLADTSEARSPLAALIESGQRGVIFQECFGPQTEQAESSLKGLDEKLDAHAKQLAGAGGEAQARIGLGISPHAPYSVSAKLYERAAQFAIDRHLDMAIHAAESADETSLLIDGSGSFGDSLLRRGINFDPPGCSTIKYFDRLGVLDAAPLLIHCVKVDHEDIGLIAEHRARVAHCPKSNAKFGQGIAPLLELQRAGVRVGLGTDSVASNNTADMIEEARFCSLLHRGGRGERGLCPAEEMIRLMTIEGARVLDMEQEIGSLEPGKQADLIAINLKNANNIPNYDPATAIIYSCSGRDVILTVVAGTMIYEGDRVLTLDEEETICQVREVRDRLR
jgi:cytosine/adenosine deaminase-related metal-dependent hydrolase